MAITEQKQETAIANVNGGGVAKAPIMTGDRGLQFSTLGEICRFADCVIQSGFAPKGMTKMESVVVAMQMGFEIGLSPMQAIQNIAVINGRPCVWGDSVKALCVAHHACLDFSEWFEGKEGADDYKAVCEVKRRGWERPVRQEFSVGDAKKAKLWAKEGPWTFYPKRMLQMRARGFAARDAFPDALKGVWTREEAQDMPYDADVAATAVVAPTDMDSLAETLTAHQKPDTAPIETREREKSALPTRGDYGIPVGRKPKATADMDDAIFDALTTMAIPLDTWDALTGGETYETISAEELAALPARIAQAYQDAKQGSLV